jgi:hypothetical protein
VNWIRSRATGRWRAVGAGLGIGAAGSIFFTLPVLPIAILHDTPVVSVNADLGETVAWPN